MNNALMIQKLAAGYAKAAAIIGVPNQVYRTTPAASPTVAPTATAVVATLPAAFAPTPDFKRPPNDKDIYYRAFFDAAQIQPGDILVDQAGRTFSIIQSAGLTPPVALLCLSAITVSRDVPRFSVAEGAGSSTQVVMTDWPCQINLKRDKGTSAPIGFPGATNDTTPMPEWMMYVGLFDEMAIRAGDQVTDNTGAQYKVDAVNLNALGLTVAMMPYTPAA